MCNSLSIYAIHFMGYSFLKVCALHIIIGSVCGEGHDEGPCPPPQKKYWEGKLIILNGSVNCYATYVGHL